MWRCACRDHGMEQYADNCSSIMTGGDYAMIRAVEFFEDYQSFGRRQVAEQQLSPVDMLVAITEGGETSSVLGTCAEALSRGSRVFLMFNRFRGQALELCFTPSIIAAWRGKPVVMRTSDLGDRP